MIQKLFDLLRVIDRLLDDDWVAVWPLEDL